MTFSSVGNVGPGSVSNDTIAAGQPRGPEPSNQRPDAAFASSTGVPLGGALAMIASLNRNKDDVKGNASSIRAGGDSVKSLFAGDAELIHLLNLHAQRTPELMSKMALLRANDVRVNLSHQDSAVFEAQVHELLAESPTKLKCVLSEKDHADKPSLYVKEGAQGRSPEIVFASSRKDQVPYDDLAFAIDYIGAWSKNKQAWPTVYAYFKSPGEVSEKLISGIDEMPTAELRKRGDVCDLSSVGFKPYHGESAPEKITARVITIKVAQGDNKPVANAIENETRPGDIVVVDGGGHAASVTLGGITASLAEKVRGIKGILIYGEVRDQVELKSLSIPVFGLGCSSSGPTKVGPGAVHGSLDIGNVPFKSGDIIKIDHGQIVVVPSASAGSILDPQQSAEEDRSIVSASPVQIDRGPMSTRKTFEPTDKAPPKNRARPETPSFIAQLFKNFTPAQICDTASFIKSERLWGAGTDVALRMGAIPDGTTLVGEAVLSNGSKEDITSALSKAKKGDFLVVSGNAEMELTAAALEEIHKAGIGCIVINGKAIVDEAVRNQYDIPCFAKGMDVPSGSPSKDGTDNTQQLRRVEMSDGFLIKPGYVMMADIDGIAGFSPTKFSILYRAGYKKNVQEQTAEARNKSGHPHPLPAGSIVTDRYYEPFVKAHIDQFPFMKTSRGWAKMQLPVDPTEVRFGGVDQPTRLQSGRTLRGIPENITTHGENPITFTLNDEEGNRLEVEGVRGRDLFDVAVAAERGQAIEIRDDGTLVKQ